MPGNPLPTVPKDFPRLELRLEPIPGTGVGAGPPEEGAAAGAEVSGAKDGAGVID